MSMFDSDLMAILRREREVELTTYGRKTGTPSRRIIWIFPDGNRLFIRSGGGLGRDWPQNLMANGRAVLHTGGRDVTVVGKHVEDPMLARHVSDLARSKYQSNTERSADNAPLTPGETATFELFSIDQPA